MDAVAHQVGRSRCSPVSASSAVRGERAVEGALDRAVEGADVVVKLTNSPAFDDASPAFFEASMGNLAASAGDGEVASPP
ncbi:hypothetical protein ABZY14_35770 [Streptomyces sp. NPDC006617]|uniref:hypothetical protein n=1 Tax=Streptomyces sp. NPDC006617 TaxID=3155354 RepID=UPI0033A8DEB8